MGHDNADNADKGDTCIHGDRLPASSHTPSQPHSLTEKLSTQIVNAENIPGAGAMSVGVRCSEAGPSSCPLAPSSAGEVQLDTSHAPAQTTQPCPAWLALPKSPGLAEKHFQWVV